MKLQYNARRGYFLSFDVKTKMNAELDSLFIQQLKQKKKIICSTEELNSKNIRIKDLVEEILLLTEG
jgi:DNA mismatch repair ATPase MutS